MYFCKMIETFSYSALNGESLYMHIEVMTMVSYQ